MFNGNCPNRLFLSSTKLSLSKMECSVAKFLAIMTRSQSPTDFRAPQWKDPCASLNYLNIESLEINRQADSLNTTKAPVGEGKEEFADNFWQQLRLAATFKWKTPLCRSLPWRNRQMRRRIISHILGVKNILSQTPAHIRSIYIWRSQSLKQVSFSVFHRLANGIRTCTWTSVASW